MQEYKNPEDKGEVKLPPNMKEPKEIPIHKRAYGLKKGYVYNPAKKFPRNKPCPCGSEKKFKKCCLNDLPPAVLPFQAKQIQKAMEENRLKITRR